MKYTGRILRKMDRKGSALLLAISFATVTAISIGGMLAYMDYQTRSTFRTRVTTNSLDGARSTLDALSNNILHLAKSLPPSQLGGDMTKLHEAIIQVQPQAPYGSKLVENTDGDTMTYILDRVPEDKGFRTIEDQNHDWFGYSILELDYELVSAVVEGTNRPKMLGYEGAALRQRVTVRYIPLYQFAVFYEGDLEFHPGPNMDIQGKTHSNTDLFLACNNYLRFHDTVTTAGSIYRWRSGGGHQGRVEIKTPNGSGGYNWVNMRDSIPTPNDGDKWFDSLDEEVWYQGALDRWKQRVLDKSHGVQPIRPPLPTGAQMHELITRVQDEDSTGVRFAKFEMLADLIISGDPGQPDTIKMFYHTLNEDAERVFELVSDDPIGDGYVHIGEFYDGHALTMVRTIDVDIEALDDSGILDFEDIDTTKVQGNGVIYVTTKPGEENSFTLAAINKDPQIKHDADGKVVFDGSSVHPEYVTTGWHSNGNYDSMSNYQDWSRRPNAGRDAYMPAVRIINAERVPRSLDNSFALYTDRPLYTAGNINTVDRVVAVLGADAITVTSTRQWLASLNESRNHGRSDYWPDTVGAFNGKAIDTLFEPGSTPHSGENPSVYGNDESGAGLTMYGGNNHNDNNFYWPLNKSDYDSYDRRNWNRTTRIRERVRTIGNIETNVIFLMGYTPPEYNTSVANKQSRVSNSGGAHNVMRYLEDHRHKHTLRGSIIVLFDSQVATQKFRGCCNTKDYYSPPTRDYQWDPALKESVPPKGMPNFIEVKKWEMEPVSMDYVNTHLPD